MLLLFELSQEPNCVGFAPGTSTYLAPFAEIICEEEVVVNTST
jgi:hypothetical protein